MKLHIVAIGLFLAAITINVQADCVKKDGRTICGGGMCATDQYGKVFCALAGGGATRSQHGEVVCGAGQCAKDQYGEIWCSNQPGGDAMKNSMGEVVCLGDCELATKNKCESKQ